MLACAGMCWLAYDSVLPPAGKGEASGAATKRAWEAAEELIESLKPSPAFAKVRWFKV